MARPLSAIGDAIAHLDSILARLSSSEPAAAPAAPLPLTKPAVVSAEPIRKSEEVVDVKPKLSDKNSNEEPIPDILKGCNLKLPAAKAVNNTPVASGNEQNENFDKLSFRLPWCNP